MILLVITSSVTLCRTMLPISRWVESSSEVPSAEHRGRAHTEDWGTRAVAEPPPIVWNEWRQWHDLTCGEHLACITASAGWITLWVFHYQIWRANRFTHHFFTSIYLEKLVPRQTGRRIETGNSCRDTPATRSHEKGHICHILPPKTPTFSPAQTCAKCAVGCEFLGMFRWWEAIYFSFYLMDPKTLTGSKHFLCF